MVSPGLNFHYFQAGLSKHETDYLRVEGVIILTKCANRSSGYAAATFIVIFGVLAKISGLVLSIPNSVLGGASTFLFAQVSFETGSPTA